MCCRLVTGQRHATAYTASNLQPFSALKKKNKSVHILQADHWPEAPRCPANAALQSHILPGDNGGLRKEEEEQSAYMQTPSLQMARRAKLRLCVLPLYFIIWQAKLLAFANFTPL